MSDVSNNWNFVRNAKFMTMMAKPTCCRGVIKRAVFAAAIFLLAARLGAAIIWNGPLISYTQPGTDATQPANQDRLTADVWLTRNNIMGLFNAAEETSYTHFFSPTNTAWAYGELANYASLTYTNWEAWNGANPPSMVGRDAVVHLISDDIYLSINFTTWTTRGGIFAYVRSTPNTAPPPPVPPVARGKIQSGTGSFQITFTNLPNYTFSVRSATNLLFPSTNWTVLGHATDSPAGSGSYNFIDAGATTNQMLRFYRVTWP